MEQPLAASPTSAASMAIDFVGGTAVLLDVLVPAVLIREATQERLAREAAGDVRDRVFAHLVAAAILGLGRVVVLDEDAFAATSTFVLAHRSGT